MDDKKIKEYQLVYIAETGKEFDTPCDMGGTNPTWGYAHWLAEKIDTSERIAKIEVLESFWNRAVEEHLDCSDVKDLIDRMLNELKVGN